LVWGAKFVSVTAATQLEARMELVGGEYRQGFCPFLGLMPKLFISKNGISLMGNVLTSHVVAYFAFHHKRENSLGERRIRFSVAYGAPRCSRFIWMGID